MIRMGFWNCARDLWITLWATPVENLETLAAPSVARDCLLSGQISSFNEINNLALMLA